MKDTRTPLDYQWDGYAKAACDVPYDRELVAMNDKQLDIELEKSKDGSARRSALQRERDRRDHENGTYVLPVPPDETLHLLKEIGRWFKKHVLAAVVSGLILAALSTILVFYITQWLPPSQEKVPQQPPSAKAMPV